MKWSHLGTERGRVETLDVGSSLSTVSVVRFFPRPSLKGYSADLDPLAPELKLSMKRTVFFSIGTVVPPDYKRAREGGRKGGREGRD